MQIFDNLINSINAAAFFFRSGKNISKHTSGNVGGVTVYIYSLLFMGYRCYIHLLVISLKKYWND